MTTRPATASPDTATTPEPAGDAWRQVDAVLLDSLRRDERRRRQRRSRRILLATVVAAVAAIVFGTAVWRQRSGAGGALGGTSSATAVEQATSHISEGWVHWQAGRLVEARDRFAAAVRLAPEIAEGWNGLGWSRMRLGDTAAAEAAFGECLKREPAHPAALNGMGRIHFNRREFTAAERDWITAAPDAPAAWYGLAQLYLVQGRYAEAAPWAERALADQPNDEFAKLMVKAARDRQVNEGLKIRIQPRPPAGPGG